MTPPFPPEYDNSVLSQPHGGDEGRPRAVFSEPGLVENMQHGAGGEPPPAEPENMVRMDGADAWRQLLLCTRKGDLRGSAIENAILILEHRYPGYFAWNEFADEVYLVSCPVWASQRAFKARRVTNDDIIRMTALLERQGLAPSTQKTRDAIMTVAHKNAFHPARQYFDGLEWDGVPRLKKWLSYYLGSSQSYDYLATIGTMWMVAAVRRCYRPGVKFDHMLVLEGKTNKGKSTALRTLATFGRDEPEDYFCDSIALDEINEKASVALLQGKLIVEFQELDGMNKKADETLKRWITLQRDEIQKKYENATTSYPRQFVLAGTTNEDNWLRDPTGNRRYWPVRVENIDMAALRTDREQLWAEAVRLHKEDFPIWLADDNPVYKLAQAEQGARIAEDAWTFPVLRYIRAMNTISVDEILREIIPDVSKHDATCQRRVSSVLRLNGWQPLRERVIGEKNPRRVWKREEEIDQKEMEFEQ